jgi:hypothetical protein
MQANDVTRAALETIRPFVQQDALSATDAGDQAALLTRRIWDLLGAAAPHDPQLTYPLTVFRREPDDQRNLERLAGALAAHLAGQAGVLAELYGLTAQLQWIAQQAGVTITLTNTGTNAGQQVGYNSGAVTQHTDQSGPRGGVHFGSDGQFGDVSIGDVAGRDVIRTEFTQGDRISTGAINGSGIAIGRGARSTVRTGDTGGGAYSDPILKIVATLSDVSRHIAAAPYGDAAAKAELAHLVAHLGAVLEPTPAEQAGAAEALAELTQTAITQAVKSQPNQLLVQVTTAALIQTAQTLAAALPAAPTIAQRIADTVQRIAATA